MKFDLGNINCIYCNSSNLEYCDWYSDESHENIDDIYFMNEVEEHIQKNFVDLPEQEYLFHCKNCNKWFVFETKTKKYCYSLLPFSKVENIPTNCYLLLNPIDLTPQSLQIDSTRISIISYSHSISSGILSSNKYGPFYPYALGTYDLICSIDKTISNAPNFKIQISKKFSSFFQLEKNIDLEFFRFSIDWYSSEGEEVLHQVDTINKSTIEANFNIDEFVEEAINNKSFMTSSVPEEASVSISLAASILRNKQAYRFITWLENELRKFIWNEYKIIYSNSINSPKWWKGCFPDEVIHKIKENQDNDLKIGQKINYRFPLAYADFDNLLTLLEKEWLIINKKLKRDFDVIKGHFKYMKHFRNSIAHSRYLSHEDIMQLQSNAIKFMSLIGITKFTKDKVIFYKDIGNAL